MLDQWLTAGLGSLSQPFVEAQVRFVASCQQADGGFRGRQGESDLYYTDFALRTLAWLAPTHTDFERGLRYMAQIPLSLSLSSLDTLDCFHVLNARRLALRHGVATAAWTLEKRPFDERLIADQLCQRMLSGKGFARSASDTTPSAYHTFIGALCLQMLATDMPQAHNVIACIQALECDDGGYVESIDSIGQGSQTSATAAAVALQLMYDAMPPARIAPCARFLASMQGADGGLRPHAVVEASDLLSTFTGLITLSSLGELQQIDLARVAEFLRASAHSDGGFLACPDDDTPDVEYTYYGVATLALLRTATKSMAKVQ